MLENAPNQANNFANFSVMLLFENQHFGSFAGSDLQAISYLPDSNSFHPPNPRAAKALLMFICDDFLLLKMGSTVGILDPMIEVFGK